jgi:hypothetical protein
VLRCHIQAAAADSVNMDNATRHDVSSTAQRRDLGEYEECDRDKTNTGMLRIYSTVDEVKSFAFHSRRA